MGNIYFENEQLNISLLWNCKEEQKWKVALKYYDAYLKPHQIAIENRMNNIDSTEVKNYNAKEFYKFLYEEYFVWKYTAKNRLATTRKSLMKYEESNCFQELEKIKEVIFKLNHNDIEKNLKNVQQIRGLGISGASGLLAILFPQDFGTVDQFAVKALLNIRSLKEYDRLTKINPDSIKAKDGVLVINIMREKAKELNNLFNTDYWTPRKIDMILWCIGR